jgi:GT2 family glycosyltransferase
VGGPPYEILCLAGGPSAISRLRSRFPGVTVVDPNEADDGSIGAALARIQAETVVVVRDGVALDPVSAAALVGMSEEELLVSPLLVDYRARVLRAGFLPVCDPARGSVRIHEIDLASSLDDLPEPAHPQAFDGSCLVARTRTLRRIAPDEASVPAWIAATSQAARSGLRLVLASGVAVGVATSPFADEGIDPSDPALENVDCAAAPHAALAAHAARGRLPRAMRNALGIDQTALDDAPHVVVVAIGCNDDERALPAATTCSFATERIVVPDVHAATAALAGALETRGDRYVAIVDGRARLDADWLDAAIDALERTPFAAIATCAPHGVDARATVVAPSRFPMAERLEAFDTVHGSVADLAMRLASRYRLGVVRVSNPRSVLPALPPDRAFVARHGVEPAAVEISLAARRTSRFSGIASIIMLSWNAPQYTRTAVESIRAVTRYPHEIIVVDNGSGEETLDVLAALEAEYGVRVVRNGRNLGFGGGMNVGMQHARGDVVVILNNDVIVTEGWLEDLVRSLEARPAVGCTAPRSNRIASEAVVPVSYADLDAMHRFAAERRTVHRGRGFLADRVVGFCLCLDRRVIDEVGGFDPIYRLGNFEDDDLCIRIRAAGWQMFVCDDVFIHHFGSASFAANGLDHRALMEENWRAFCRKWELGDLPLGAWYDARRVIARARAQQMLRVPLGPAA